MQPVSSSSSSFSHHSEHKRAHDKKAADSQPPRLFIADGIDAKIVSYLTFREMTELKTLCTSVFRLYQLRLPNPSNRSESTEATVDERSIPYPFKLRHNITDAEIHDFEHAKISLKAVTNACSLFKLIVDPDHNKSLAPEQVRLFTSLTTLKVSKIYGVDFDLREMSSSIPTLTHLDITGRINVIDLATFCPNLEHLVWDGNAIYQNTITDESIKHLEGFAKLKHLELVSCDRMTHVAMEHLSKHTQLTALRLLGCCFVNNKSLETISKFEHLESLSLLGSRRVDNDGIVKLKPLTRLRKLELIACPVITHVGYHRLISLNKSLVVKWDLNPTDPFYRKLVINSLASEREGIVSYSYSTDADLM